MIPQRSDIGSSEAGTEASPYCRACPPCPPRRAHRPRRTNTHPLPDQYLKELYPCRNWRDVGGRLPPQGEQKAESRKQLGSAPFFCFQLSLAAPRPPATP